MSIRSNSSTDHLASFLFCPTEIAKKNLINEGIKDGISITGDIMYDASLFYRKLLDKELMPANLIPEYDYYLLTLHRAENTDSYERLKSIVDALNTLTNFKGIFPIHPRTKKMLNKYNLNFKPHISLINPVGFLDMLRLEKECSFIVTDSGGVQKEAYFFNKPCITLRDQTEWVELVES